MTTTPAGEQHTGSPNLTGKGQAPSPISDTMVETARVTIPGGAPRADVRRALEAAYPAIRQQVAEEIAVVIEAQAGDGEWAGDYYRKAAQAAREIGGKA